MDLKRLESFVRVAEFGSITRAAAVIGLSQSVVSRQVRQLEVELKEHLLLRNGRGVCLTRAGKLLFQHGQGILRQVQVAQTALQETRNAVSGKVVIGIPPSLARSQTVALVQAFRLQFPNCALGIKEGLSHALREWLLLDRLDFALLFNPVHNAQLTFAPFRSEPVMLVGGPTAILPERIHVSDLAQYPLIIPSQPNALRRLVETEAARLGLQLDIVLEIDGIPSLLDLIALDLGYGVLFRSALQGPNLPPGLKAVPLARPELRTHLFVATASQRPLTLLAEQTLALIDTIIPGQRPIVVN